MLRSILFWMLCASFIMSGSAQNPVFQEDKVSVSSALFLGKSEPLGESVSPFIDITGDKKAAKNIKKEIPNFQANQIMPKNNAESALPKLLDPIRQQMKKEGGEPIEFLVNVDGINQNEANILPPDPNGDIGTNFYIQVTNQSGGTAYKIFDKEGNLVQGINNLNALWIQFGKVGFGDPIVFYDQAVSRWVIAEFAQFGSNALLVAVSETDDPLGSYFGYQFTTPNFPDYPKYGVWNDGYYVTTNEPSALGIPVYILDREAMLNGEPNAKMIRIEDIGKFNASDPAIFQVATPADWDGMLPPPENAPHYSVRIYDDAWSGGVDKLEIFQTFTDFENPNDSYIEGPIDIPLAPFESSLCETSIFDCLDQPGNSTLSALQQVIMRRVQYRNFGNYEAMVLDFSVDVDQAKNQAGIRWVELRKYPDEEWGLYQEGTWAPDSLNRFMGTIAMDGKGNIALGYSTGDADTYLGLRVTGRKASDPLGEMSIMETELMPGLGINPNVRWGDYSSMSIDPYDESTFWFTGEYMAESFWSTRIGKFKINIDTIDVGPYSFLGPGDSAELGSDETVSIEFRNYGLEPQANFNIGLMLDGQIIVQDLVTDTIYPEEIVFHEFSQTVDMNQVKAYEFKIFTDLETDQNILNDTLRIKRYKFPHYDVSVVKINGIRQPACEDSMKLDIIVQNIGVEPVVNFQFHHQLNDGSVTDFLWDGFLESGEQDTIQLTIFGFEEGFNNLKAYVSDPNGNVDEVPENDAREASFSYISSMERLSLDLISDNAGYETSWEMWDDNEDVIYSGGPYEFGGIHINEDWCVEEGCYIFSLYDTGGNGWSSPNISLGFPNYEIRGENDVLIGLLQEQNFGFLEELEFCLPFVCNLGVSLNFEAVSSPGAGDGIIALLAQNALPPVKYSIDGGENYKSTPVFAGLNEGTYFIEITDLRGCIARDTLVLPLVSATKNYHDQVKVEVLPNPTDGFFFVNVFGMADRNSISVQILNQYGQMVKERNLVNYDGILTGQISLFDEPDGIYYLRLRDREVHSISKLIKQ